MSASNMTSDHLPESRRNIARVFAILDALFVLLHIHRIPRLLIRVIQGDLVSVLVLIVDGMLCVSAMAWWQQRQLRFLMTWILFPFRLLIAAFSLSWLATIAIAVLPKNLTVHYSVWGAAAAVETFRLIYTIHLHRTLHSNRTSAAGDTSITVGNGTAASNPYYPPTQR